MQSEDALNQQVLGFVTQPKERQSNHQRGKLSNASSDLQQRLSMPKKTNEQ